MTDPGCLIVTGAGRGIGAAIARLAARQGYAVAPGLIETDLHADNGAPDRVGRMAPTVPMQRGGRPEEVADGVLWLLSSAASYITGTILEIGGGR